MSKADKEALRRGREERHVARLAEVHERVKCVRIGSTRADVEQLLPEKNGGLQGPNATTYYEDPEILIEVTYDQTGGDWSPKNRVLQPPRIYRGPMTMD